MKIVEKLKSNYVILSPGEPSEVEKYAAEEFQKYLKKITDVEIPIIQERKTSQNNIIYIGSTKKTLAIVKKQKLQKLGEEGIIIKTKNNNLFITGGHTRGTLYAVYSFLENYLGVR